MKYILAAVLLLLAVPALAQGERPTTTSQIVVTTHPMPVTLNDIQVYATAIRLAAAQCGADKEVACNVGLNEKNLLAKLEAAAKALADAQKNAVHEEKKDK